MCIHPHAHVQASQPFDTMKTKMQAEAKYANEGMVNTARAIARTDGLKGFYRGMVPILLSTGVQKSALFAGYAGAKRWCDQSQIGLLTTPLPGFGGMSLSVVVGSIAASTARTAVEVCMPRSKKGSQPCLAILHHQLEKYSERQTTLCAL